jgi:glucan endo-1,3-alpha-glucosidase
VRPAGGWGLTATVCPNDLDVCGGGWCCPTSLTCVQTGGSVLSNICCPGSKLYALPLPFSADTLNSVAVNCIAAFTASPTCADDTWSLWDKSTGGIVANGYFCCAPGQAGLLDGTCIASDAISSPTQEALQVSHLKGPLQQIY